MTKFVACPKSDDIMIPSQNCQIELANGNIHVATAPHFIFTWHQFSVPGVITNCLDNMRNEFQIL